MSKKRRMKIVGTVTIINGKCEMADVCKNESCKYYATRKELEQMTDLETENASLLPSERKPYEKLEFECTSLEQQAAEKRKKIDDECSNDY